jgi:hypothetical protein
MLELKINTVSANNFLDNLKRKLIDKAITHAQSKVILQIKRDVTPHVPRASGELLNSWKVEKTDNKRLQAGFDIVYAMYQHQGRRADGSHIIRNRPAGGKSFFLKETIDDNYQKYFKIYARAIDEYLQKNT